MDILCKKVSSRTYYKINKMFILALLLVIFSLKSFAQKPGSIEGIVSDAETYKPLSDLTVELLNAADSMVQKRVFTDTDGKYLFHDIVYGKYTIRISGITYRKQLISDIEITPEKPVVKFGVTNLTPVSKSLKEVSVVGYKLTGQIEDDKTIYTVKDKSADLAQSGLDLLRQIPDVEVDFMNNNVKLAGSNNILFQVNGKRVDRNYLLQLNPKLIDKVEVITNPGVKYDGNIDAVINITLKRNINVGFSGRINTEIPTSNTYFSNHSASFDYFVKHIRFFVSGNYGQNQWKYDNNLERTSINELVTQLTLKESTMGWGHYKYGGFGYGADWFLDDNNMINFSSSIRPNLPNIENFSTDNYYLLNDNYTHTKGTQHNDSRNNYYDYSLFYRHKFKKKDHEISFEGNYNQNNAHSLEENSEEIYGVNDSLTGVFTNQRSQISENNQSQLMLKSDYIYPVTDKLKLSEGYQRYIIQAKNSLNDNYTGYFDKINYTENRNSLYSNISFTVGKLNLQSGVRFEFTDINIDHISDIKNSYGCLLPFISGQYRLWKTNTIRLNYRKSIQRPGIYQLSPFRYTTNSYTISVGNPNLTPGYNDRFELTHRIQFKGPMYFSYRPYINFISKGIRQVYMKTDSILQRVNKNVSNEFEYGATLSGLVTLVKGWEISPNFTFYEHDLQALPKDSVPAQTRTGWRMSINSDVRLPKDWSIFVNYSYSGPTISFQNVSERNYDLTIGFNKLITKKFSIQVLTLNPGSHRYVFNKNTINTGDLVQERTGVVVYSWIFNIRLKYNFNMGKEGKKVERQRDPNTENEGKGGGMGGG